MNSIVAIFAFIFLCFNAKAQNIQFKDSLNRPQQLTYYSMNHLGDYSSIINNEISKKTPQKTFTFKEPFLGTISIYDERNPLQQLVFYKNTQQIVLLDNQLSVKNRRNLMEAFPEIDASYVSMTAQSTLWIFDNASRKWGVLDLQTNQITYISNPIVDYDFLTTSGNEAYWQNGSKVYGIDIYGKLMKEYSLDANSILLAINGDKILYQLNKNVFLYNTTTEEKSLLKEVRTEVEKAFFNAENITILTNEMIFLFKLK